MANSLGVMLPTRPALAGCGRRKAGELEQVFAGYRSQVDWPGGHVWRELSVAFPLAKVVHTVRPGDVWWNSFSRTIGKLGANYKQMPLPPHIRDMLDAPMR